jgi:hypothetical protein
VVNSFSFIVQVMRDAYAVILAGGTFQPIEETQLRLCPSLPPRDINFFTCNHIVSPESILPVSVTCGPSGMPFDFSYKSRSSPSMVCTFYFIPGHLLVCFGHIGMCGKVRVVLL